MVQVKGQLIFLNTGYNPGSEERKRLEFYQEQLTLYHAELAYKSKGLSKGEMYLFKERSHNLVRDAWRLYQGMKEDPKSKS